MRVPIWNYPFFTRCDTAQLFHIFFSLPLCVSLSLSPADACALLWNHPHTVFRDFIIISNTLTSTTVVQYVAVGGCLWTRLDVMMKPICVCWIPKIPTSLDWERNALLGHIFIFGPTPPLNTCSAFCDSLYNFSFGDFFSFFSICNEFSSFVWLVYGLL